ncbi:MAG: L-cysteine:1D-myo-inosityl 2-amino-2-deoxy-alpha-D-glucopyranoside ligase MshC [uncultured Friedmanniella sp.]|uniref:L-cysteine:1D-myo-inositol 2-amino-2-deoxy-alpha-D-glucopyranoside ligase n=1 Tax=uncultured Friedmanniella sp. TaxID=335381 RepID=A0A6J4KV17_9ACTN|nr:cysteine--1-D-myo-inosityl 2-amino-2-deoxy-alpha-D-glucopyranoside ligase [uncultured Friedmanniella sp.]CAA9316191.1 MAG: L-cysteine:1D-myo-inosityl 2-amino-2-deoxy-alpha-D-glucopyranoside ligase MshC [uncultured Friedmanniella sp.]
MQAWRSGPVPQLDRPEGSPAVRAFDSAAQQLVPVGPAEGTARMYVCGITPYDATHIGHANTYVSFDLLNRVWRDAGLEVLYVQNVTDVDDPLIERAHATGVDWAALAAEQTQLFREDMEALNVLPPSHYVGAVESVPLIVELVADLQTRGVVYAVEDEHAGDLYLDQAQDADFGSLSHLDEDAARPVFAERGGDPGRTAKKGVLDSLVWLRHREGDPSWPSPFGDGRPGWHVECAAIALDLLGPDFDVQAGGSDLVFPHHEMSASVGRLATGKPFARAYLHSGMVALDGEKMSKSRGNLVFVSRLRRDGVDPMAVRLALLDHHYRDDWEWTPELLAAAQDRLSRWREAVRLDAGVDGDEVVSAIRTALADDLVAPAAIAAVDAWAGASTVVESDDAYAPALVARACDALLGVRL